MEILTYVLLFGLALGWFVAYALNARRLFLLFALLFGGGYFAVGFSQNATTEVAVCAFVSVCAFLHLALLAAWEFRRRKRAKKRKRELLARSLVFTLPEKDNAYLRDRLRVDLHGGRTGVSSQETDVRLDYIRKLTAKLKGAALSVTDRMQINELSRTITLCASKEKTTAEDTRALNECFASLLKMSAKYGL